MSTINDSAWRNTSDQKVGEAARRLLSGAMPIPTSIRWQPLRAGLMNLFLFEDERFPFYEGRLLLRGSNGTGKSRVLAMTLPLLLDGSLQPTRVEPDRDATRQVSWNVLGDDQSSATGYTWLEFGRTEEGVDHYLTIGMGVRAVRGGSMKSWFFLTKRRVDESLALKSPDGVPLTSRALEEALQGNGQVIEMATEYRRAVDEHLFRLGDRYEPLIDLLLQLRQPKLAEKLDIDQMEAGLRSSLPPLSPSLLNDAADAFRDLDDYRNSLAADQQLLEHVQRFMRPYRDHIHRGVLRAIKSLTTANSSFENEQRKLRQSTELFELASLHCEELQRRKQALDVAIEADRAAIEELQRSPEMRGVQRLDELRELVRKSDRRLVEAKQQWELSERQLAGALQQSERLATAVQSARQAVNDASEDARTVAAPEALQNRHRDWLREPLVAGEWETYRAAESKLRKEVVRLERSAERLQQLTRTLDNAQQQLSHARRRVEEAQSQLSEREEVLSVAHEVFERSRESTWQAILDWHESAVPLYFVLPPLTQWLDVWQAWTDSLGQTDASSRDPSDEYLQVASAKVNRHIAAERASVENNIQALELTRATLESEERYLQAGHPIAPPARPHRDLSHRATLAGAPLWHLIAFQPSVPQSEWAGWEAALEDAGLLDAWLTPDGHLLSLDSADEATFDILLHMPDMPLLAPERQLARVVAIEQSACEQAGIQSDVIERVLAAIGVGVDAGQTWVAADGSWRNGPLRGRWLKDQPQFVGTEVRDRYRAARLAQIAAELQALLQQIAENQQALQAIVEHERMLNDLLNAFPSRKVLLAAYLRVSSAAADVDAAQVRVSEALATEQSRRLEFDHLLEQRTAEATDFGLVAWADKGDELTRRLGSYLDKLQTLSARMEGYCASQSSHLEAEENIASLTARQQSSRAWWQRSEAEHAAEGLRLAELERTIGQDADAVMQRLDDRRRQYATDVRARDETDDDLSSARENRSATKVEIDHSQAKSNESDATRRAAADWFSALHERGLLKLLEPNIEAPELPWSMTAALRVARQLDSLIGDLPIDENAWNRSRDRLFDAQNDLRQSVLTQHEFSIAADNLSDGLQIVTLSLQGEAMAPDTAVGRLQSEIENRKRILDEREQETLERYLLGEVAEGLRLRMLGAARLVETMTAEVSRRPMATGMQMRFKWQQAEDGPPGLAEACEVLATAAATWSPDEREQIKRFLQHSIKLQRESGQAESWPEQLAAALDYRLWHRIAIERRSGPEADWKRLTRRTYGSGSGGEKAIALTLPQMAAVAAYYESAHPHAPRFILLDEAFAGVSTDGREGCMELIEAFKLDVVMTSETEWGMYPGVRALAICQLDRFPEFNAVVNRVFLWNGRELMEAISSEEAREAATQPLFFDKESLHGDDD